MQAAVNFEPGQSQANPDFLNAIIAASAQFSIVASQDIVDVRGIKLWAKGLPVSAVLQQRLLERKLRNPIESCLNAQDGVTLFYLHAQLQALLGSDTSLARAVQPWAGELESNLKALPLHPVAQLLLTAALATRPQTVAHAVQSMALAGAMALAQRSPVDLRLAMLGGLLHDVGEVYIQSQFLDDENAMDLVVHQHRMVHPRLAQLLLVATTNYPATLCRAVGEHHERQNGSGYPARLVGDAISPLGLLLSAVETSMALVPAPIAGLTRASLALRVIPGEYPERYSSVVFNMARAAQESVPTNLVVSAQGTLQYIDKVLLRAQHTAQALQQPRGSAQRRHIVDLALLRIARLRQAWNALGVWGLQPEQLTPDDHFEMDLAGTELQQRLYELQRECMLLAELLPAAEKAELSPIWADLQVPRA